MDFLQQIYLENTLRDWLSAFIFFVLIFFFCGILKRYVLRRMSRLDPKRDQDIRLLLEDLLRRTNTYLIFFLAIYIGSLYLKLPLEINEFLQSLAIVVLILQFAFWGLGAIDFFVKRRISADPDNKEVSATTMGAVSLIAKISLWSIVVLLILENVTGIEMNTLIATLGVGGIAVALAVQNILGDLFSSVSIALDKPFVIGDAISVDEFSGTVEQIGLKSTHLRSVSGEQLVFANSDLLSSRIRNYQRRKCRQVNFSMCVTYQTPYKKLVSIPAIIQEIIEKHKDVSFGRVHLTGFGEFALIFECVYYVEVPDFDYHQDTLHAINLAILARFNEQGIEFAYPTRTVLMDK